VHLIFEKLSSIRKAQYNFLRPRGIWMPSAMNSMVSVLASEQSRA